MNHLRPVLPHALESRPVQMGGMQRPSTALIALPLFHGQDDNIS